MPDIADLGGLAGRLLSLEIDTMVSDGIAAERMPADGQALIRIACLYKDFLSRAIEEVRDAGVAVPGLPPFVGQDGKPTPFDRWDVDTGGLRTFTALLGATRACQAARETVPPPNALKTEHEAILARVGGACGDIRAMLLEMGLKDAAIDGQGVDWAEESGRDWPAFDRDALIALRRIWETGVDVIVMQTIVRLDGSVTTRVLDGWDTPAAAPVCDIHYRAVDIALARWSFLVQTAQQVAGFFFHGDPDGPPLAAPAGGAVGRLAR